MFGRRLRSVLVLVAVAAALVRLVQALRGEPTSAFSTHPSTDGDPLADHLAPAAAAEVGSEQLAAAAVEPTTIEPDTLFDVEAAAVEPNDIVEPTHTAVATDTVGPTDTAAVGAAWRPPVDGACPAGYPVKAKLKSGIFHLPGMSAYARTTPDRCYPDADAALIDGLRPAKR